MLGSVLNVLSCVIRDSVDVLSVFEVIMFSFKFDCVTLVFSCYSDSVKENVRNEHKAKLCLDNNLTELGKCLFKRGV